MGLDLARPCPSGRGQWLDSGRTRCLVLWRKLDEWGGVVQAWVRDNALDEGVVTVDEIINGDDTKGTGAPHRPKESCAHTCPQTCMP